MHLGGGQPQAIPHKLVGLADELHVAVLDAVVDHFHKVARAVLAHPVTAGGAVLHLGADSLEDGLDGGPRRRGAAGHHGGAIQSALLSAGYAAANIEEALALHVFGAPDGVREMAVAAVDEDIAGLQDGQKLVYETVYRLSGLDHHHDLPGLLQIIRQLLQGAGADDVLPLGATLHELFDLLGGAVEHGHGETFGLHVHHQVFAHDGQTDKANIRFFHHVFPLISAHGRYPRRCPRFASRPRARRSH